MRRLLLALLLLCGAARADAVLTGGGSGRVVLGILDSSTAGAISYNDGQTWASITVSATYSGGADGIAYGNGRWCAMAGSTSTTWSTNGATWNTGTIASGNWAAVRYANGIFVAVDSSAGESEYSTDCNTWSAGGALGYTENFYSIAWNGTIFCAVGTAHSVYSTNAVSWVGEPMGTSRSFWGVAWNGTNFVVLTNSANGGQITAYSPDCGQTAWVQTSGALTVSQAWQAQVYGSGILVATSGTSGNTANYTTSSAGLSYSSLALANTGTYQALAWSGINFVAASGASATASYCNTSGTCAASTPPTALSTLASNCIPSTNGTLTNCPSSGGTVTFH